MPESVSYQTVNARFQAEIRRIDSTFIAYLDPLEDEMSVKVRLAEIRTEHRAATHHCYAYRLSGPRGALIERAADAGEPLHSAGQPILKTLQGHNLCDVLLTVVRYFGGTKLGIGGLIRAYGDATKAVIANAQLITKVPQMEFQLSYPYALTGAIMRVLQRHQAQIEGIDYGERTTLRARVTLTQAAALQCELTDATSGQIEVELG